MMTKTVHGGNIYQFDHKVYDFSANLNPLGMPPAVKQAIIDSIDAYESYPDPLCRELLTAISRFHHVSPDRICCGNGAADLIFRIPLAFQPKKALILSPTFAEYEQALGAVGCRVSHHFLLEEKGFVPDEGILDSITAELDMMFLCSPNNPTGIPVERELMAAIMERCRECGVILIIDECFTEFMEQEEKYSMMDIIEELPHVIILKAFTKIFAMAGLRLGYCICGNTDFAAKIRDTLQPWPVSTAASKAGCAALELTGFIEETKKYVKENREFLVNGLQNMGFRVYNTKVNYILFRSCRELVQPLLSRDILIRSCSNYPTLDESYYRIAVRTKEENAYFLRCLQEVTEEQKRKMEDNKNG